MTNNYSFTDLIFESGALKRIKRTPIQNPFIQGDSVAEHSYRTGLIASYLAKLEGANLEKVLMMAMLHDISEVRCTDTNFMQKPYVTRDEDLAHKSIFKDFANSKDYLEVIDEYEKRESLESKVVKDADRIELMVTLLELVAIGSLEAKKHMDKSFNNWIKACFTDSARKLVAEILKSDSTEWAWKAASVKSN